MRIKIFALLTSFLCTTAAFAGSFKDNGNGIVTDQTTNLMWQQCPYGLSGAGCATATSSQITWDNSIVYCEGLLLGGYKDWRLPNVKELKSIAEITTYGPAIDTTYFPNTASENYWSSTSCARNTTFAWYVNFNEGYAWNTSKTNILTYHVRCVRGQ